MKISNETNLCISIASKPGNFGATFHNAGYRKLGIPWLYLPRKVVSEEELKEVMSALKVLNIRGCSVSMPHNETVIKYLDEIDPPAEKIGAVNTVKLMEGSKLKGFNTDYLGILDALSSFSLSGKNVLLLGAGGVSRALAMALKDKGAHVVISNRSSERAKDLASRFALDFIEFSEIADIKGELLVNATSVGMKDEKSSIVEKNIIDNFNIVKDVVIYPAETKLLRLAKELGKTLVPGTSMCLGQAAAQFEIYTGKKVPDEVLEETLKSLS